MDAAKLDAVRKALRAGDVAAATKHGLVFELLPVSAQASVSQLIGDVALPK